MAAASLNATPTPAHLRDRLRLIFAVRINKRDGLRQFGFALVVVGNDQIDAKFPAQRRLLIGRNTAVNRYNQFHALFLRVSIAIGVQPRNPLRAGRGYSWSHGRLCCADIPSADRSP